MIYAEINLNPGRTYIQPLDELDILIDEIKEAAEGGYLESVWTISFVEMSQEQYEKLPEFAGH